MSGSGSSWFAKLMQRGVPRTQCPGHARGRSALAGAGVFRHADPGQKRDTRDARYDAIVQMLRDREVEDRDAREKRQRWYKNEVPGPGSQVLGGSKSSHLGPRTPDLGPRTSDLDASVCPPTRLHKFRTKVPCRATPEGRALLDELTKQFSGSTVTFPHVTSQQQAVMLTRRAGAQPRQIGWVEHSVQSDPKLCNVRNQGLTVETDGGTMLVLRFRYPPTAVRMSCKHDPAPRPREEMAFTEIRPALDLRSSDKGSSPRLVWITRPEIETMNALRSRDYEAFYVRFKLEVQAGIWSSLSSLLSSSTGSQWHQGSYYTVVWEPDATNRRIYQRTVDDSGRAIDIGSDRIYDAAAATDILLLYLEGDILADFADIYFTLQSLSTADAYFLKEEFFTVIRRFWASSQSLASRYGSDLAAVVRMTQRALPMPAQAPLLKQDWTNLRQSLVDRYGEGGRKAADLVGQDIYRPRIEPLGWPFASFPAGEVNIGLRFVYRQEWRPLGAQQGDTTRNLDEVVNDVVNATVDAVKWPRDFEGSINAGIRALAATSDMGLEAECRESSRDTSTRLSDIMLRMASKIRDETAVELLTRPAEIQNVVLVAEKLPTPADIDIAWVRRHESILAKVLLDESVRDALDTIGQDARNLQLDAKRHRLYEHVRANILHYQRAIWQQEDPQQRTMRYRKSGKKVPLEWRFELESGGALTIDELSDRLAATNVDGQFAAYSGGREADLDQVIDPAGPVGYYGNYAIYHMRPEFGSEDLFSMLHFFKSPYLHPNPETGDPEVEDPVQIQISEDRAVLAASDRVIDSREAPEGYQLILEGGHGIELLSTNGHRDAEAEWAILRHGGARISNLLAGAGGKAARSDDPEAEQVILVRDDEGWTLTAGAGAGATRAHEGVIVARDDRALRLISRAGGGASQPHRSVILARDNGERMPNLLTGRAHDSETERVILVRDDGGLRLTAVAGGGSAFAHERVILARGDEWLRPSLVAE